MILSEIMRCAISIWQRQNPMFAVNVRPSRSLYPPAHASRACPTCALIDAKPGQARVSWRGGSAAVAQATVDGVGGLRLLRGRGLATTLFSVLWERTKTLAPSKRRPPPLTPGLSQMSKEVEEEVLAPCCEFHFTRGRSIIGM